MATAALGANFEIRVDGVVRTHRDVRDTAIEAVRFLQQRNVGAKVQITDLRDGSNVPFDPSRARLTPWCKTIGCTASTTTWFDDNLW